MTPDRSTSCQIDARHSNTALADHRLCGHRTSNSLADELNQSPSYLHITDDDVERLSLFIDLPRCPHPKGKERVNAITGEIEYLPHAWTEDDGNQFVIRCEKNTCDVCVVINAQRIAYAIQLAAPTHAIFLSLIGASAVEIRKNASRFATCIRRLIPEFQWAWAAEVNPLQTGNHLHGYVHTLDQDYEIPKRLIVKAAQKAKLGLVVGITRLDADLPADWFGYPMKSLADPIYAQRFIDLNHTQRGVQPIHASKKFWRDGPFGDPIPRRRDAEVLSYRRSRLSGQQQLSAVRRTTPTPSALGVNA